MTFVKTLELGQANFKPSAKLSTKKLCPFSSSLIHNCRCRRLCLIFNTLHCMAQFFKISRYPFTFLLPFCCFFSQSFLEIPSCLLTHIIITFIYAFPLFCFHFLLKENKKKLLLLLFLFLLPLQWLLLVFTGTHLPILFLLAFLLSV